MESGKIDIVIVEDRSRICRRLHAYLFCETCVDYDTRLIALNDHVDTATTGWEDSALFATWHHERSNRDTADRIKRTLNSRFDEGGVIQFTIFGYIKDVGIKNDRDLRKDPQVERIVKEIFRRLEQGAFYTEVADWLNEEGIKPGPYSRRQRWSGSLVSAFVHQPILKGLRVRNRKVSKRKNKTGKHESKKGHKSDLRFRKCPHLAFLDEAYYDHVIKLIDERNAKNSRTANGQADPRKNVSRSRTEFPGQHARCGTCGRLMYWHTTQGRHYLLCKGAYEYQCWHSLYVFGPDCAEKIPQAILAALSAMPEFDAIFGDFVRKECAEFQEHRTERRRTMNRQLQDVDSRIEHVGEAIERGKSLDLLLPRFEKLQQERSSILFQLQQLNNEPSPEVALPQSHELRERFAVALQNLCKADQDTIRLLRQLLPDLHIVPYEIIDGSDIVARAEFTLTLVPLLPVDLQSRPEAQVFTRRMVVTLGSISQPVKFHAEASALQQQGMKQRIVLSRCRVIPGKFVEKLKLEMIGLRDTSSWGSFLLCFKQ